MFGTTSLIILIAVLVLIFVVCREIVCWYWKINEGLRIAQDNQKVLLDIRNTLGEINEKLSSPAGFVQSETQAGQEGEAEGEPAYGSVVKPLPDLETMKYGPLMDLAKEMGIQVRGMPPKEELIRMIKESDRKRSPPPLTPP